MNLALLCFSWTFSSLCQLLNFVVFQMQEISHTVGIYAYMKGINAHKTLSFYFRLFMTF